MRIQVPPKEEGDPPRTMMLLAMQSMLSFPHDTPQARADILETLSALVKAGVSSAPPVSLGSHEYLKPARDLPHLTLLTSTPFPGSRCNCRHPLGSRRCTSATTRARSFTG